MSPFAQISVDDALQSLFRRPGLVLGPNAILREKTFAQIVTESYDETVRANGHEPRCGSEDWQGAIDEVGAVDPECERQFRDALARKLRGASGSPDMHHLVRSGWSTYVSLTYDMIFEEALRNYLDSLPTGRSATVIDSVNVYADHRTIRIYKLLGNLHVSEGDSALALSRSSLIMRQRSWPILLRSLPDSLMDAPLLFLGTETVPELARELLAVLATIGPPRPRRLLFLKGDETLEDPTAIGLLRQFDTAVVDSSLKEICDGLAALKPRQGTLAMSSGADGKQNEFSECVEQYGTYVVAVPKALPDGFVPENHRTALVDGLFRPASLDWRPFLAEWDLRRNCTDAVVEAAEGARASARRDPQSGVVVVRGEAGVGKTAVMKRSAVELAQSGYGVLWLRKAFSGGNIRQLRQLAQELAHYSREEAGVDIPPLVVFCDDPWYLQTPVEDLVLCFSDAGLPVGVVAAFRQTDYFTAEGIGSSLPGRPFAEITVEDHLDDSETDRLPGLLVAIGAATDETSAEDIVARSETHAASDVLCSLWALVPETHAQIADSLRDEYRRLGELSDTVSALAETARTSKAAKRAYECVTVTSVLKIGLPLEVLVSCLRVDYSDWIDLTASGRPLWGLLYEVEAQDGSTILYHTRNHIVTRVLIDLVNGGVGHAGEVRVLKDLVAGCSTGTPVYRAFLVDLLVNRRWDLEQRLTYEDGVELYELARETLPSEDRLLEHHMGVWMNHVGRDHRKAYEQLEKALRAEVFPGADRDAPREHIHTSMAATVVQLVKDGEQEPESGLEMVKEHLRHASRPSFFNPHSAHVSANTLYEMSQIVGSVEHEDVTLESFSEALQEIEKALQALGYRRRSTASTDKNVEMLTELQRKILSAVPEIDELENIAESRFASAGSQVGFEVIARKMLASASESNKGTDYNRVRERIDRYEKCILDAGVVVAPELLATRVDLMIRWRIQKFQRIDWEAFREDLDQVLASTRYREDVMKRFYQSVALYHLGEVSSAMAGFADIRRIRPTSLRPTTVRCYFLGPEGQPKRLQCVIEKSHGRAYASISELGTDVMLAGDIRDLGPGATAQLYVGFALNGPIALRRGAKPGELELPGGPSGGS